MDIWWQELVCPENGLQLGQLCLEPSSTSERSQAGFAPALPELIPRFHAPLLPLLAGQGSPTCSHQHRTPSRQAEPHKTPLRPCKSKSRVRLLLPFAAHKSPVTRFPGEQRGGGGKGESRERGARAAFVPGMVSLWVCFTASGSLGSWHREPNG